MGTSVSYAINCSIEQIDAITGPHVPVHNIVIFQRGSLIVMSPSECFFSVSRTHALIEEDKSPISLGKIN